MTDSSSLDMFHGDNEELKAFVENIERQSDESDIKLLFLEDRNLVGIHVRGLAKLLNCSPETVRDACDKGVRAEDIYEAQIQTAGGLQGVKFILENGVIDILEYLQDGKHKQETKDAAKMLYRRYARAGFKLEAMLQVCPEKLQKIFQQASPQPPALDPAIVLQELKNENVRLQIELACIKKGIKPQRFTAHPPLSTGQRLMQIFKERPDEWINPKEFAFLGDVKVITRTCIRLSDRGHLDRDFRSRQTPTGIRRYSVFRYKTDLNQY
ncbi:MAG: hypothetical protein VKJ24_15435 [Synechococcales bacterium]|nr:hypothetical protein [Synechococcales bacterium]